MTQGVGRRGILLCFWCGLAGMLATASVRPDEPAQGVLPPFYQVRYEPSPVAGELRLGVTYTVWIPPGVKTLRGIIVHQHGCGEGSRRSGEVAAYDFHWQALARRWQGANKSVGQALRVCHLV